MCTAPQAPAEPEPEPKFCALRKRAENLERLPAVPTSGKGPRCDSWARGNTERVCDCCCDSEVRCDARILDGILPPAPMPALTLALAPAPAPVSWAPSSAGQSNILATRDIAESDGMRLCATLPMLLVLALQDLLLVVLMVLVLCVDMCALDADAGGECTAILLLGSSHRSASKLAPWLVIVTAPPPPPTRPKPPLLPPAVLVLACGRTDDVDVSSISSKPASSSGLCTRTLSALDSAVAAIFQQTLKCSRVPGRWAGFGACVRYGTWYIVV